MPYDDRIFGAMIHLDQRLNRHMKDSEGVKHRMRLSPAQPVPGQDVAIFVTTCGSLACEGVYCWYTTDGREPEEGSATVICLEREDEVWDVITWSYLQRWRGVVPSQMSGTVIRYRIGTRLAGSGRWVFADNQANVLTRATPFGYYTGNTVTPPWQKRAVIYHVFLDRFFPGEGKDWQKPQLLSGFFGGTLRGVMDKLDYIQSLGFNTLWLSPLFASPSHHGYNATDYYTVEPRLGSNEDLDELIAAAHHRGMFILLDFVANHWSRQHPTFQSAVKDPDSPYRAWYEWEKWPDTYETYFGVKELPKINLEYPPAREYLLRCAQHWLEKGVDGYRLDYALGPSYDFWAAFQQACREVNPQCWLLGEVVDMAPVQLSYASSMDGTLDFLLNRGLRETFALNKWKLTQFESFLSAHENYFPGAFSRPAFLDNHDMNRFLYISEGDTAKLKLAALVLYTLPGPPIIYYGTEVGVTQQRPIHQNSFGVFEEARMPMKWGEEQDADLRVYFQRLGELRQKHPVLWDDHRGLLHLDDQTGTYAYLRWNERERVIVALNINDAPRSITLTGTGLGPGVSDRLNENPVRVVGESLTVELAGKRGAYIV
ncbi:MAG: alpha-amylase family glycosyl hydrolase [Chloroflexota bacterium]